MKISLITVCYNAEKTIADAMESVLTQRHGDTEIEYVVVDGGSTDGTVEIIKKFEREGLGQRSRSTMEGFSFKWVSEKDRGMYDALNKGIKMATGDVIGILNADDVLAEENTLAKIAAAFADPTIDGTYSDIRFVRDDVHCTTTTSDYDFRLRLDSKTADRSLLQREVVQAVDVSVRDADRASEHVLPQGVLREVGRLFARLRDVRRLRVPLPVRLEEQGEDEVPADLHDRDAHGRRLDGRLAHNP